MGKGKDKKAAWYAQDEMPWQQQYSGPSAYNVTAGPSRMQSSTTTTTLTTTSAAAPGGRYGTQTGQAFYGDLHSQQDSTAMELSTSSRKASERNAKSPPPPLSSFQPPCQSASADQMMLQQYTQSGTSQSSFQKMQTVTTTTSQEEKKSKKEKAPQGIGLMSMFSRGSRTRSDLSSEYPPVPVTADSYSGHMSSQTEERSAASNSTRHGHAHGGAASYDMQHGRGYQAARVVDIVQLGSSGGVHSGFGVGAQAASIVTMATTLDELAHNFANGRSTSRYGDTRAIQQIRAEIDRRHQAGTTDYHNWESYRLGPDEMHRRYYSARCLGFGRKDVTPYTHIDAITSVFRIAAFAAGGDQAVMQHDMEIIRVLSHNLEACPYQFDWVTCAAGYNCQGGQHFIPHCEIDEVLLGNRRDTGPKLYDKAVHRWLWANEAQQLADQTISMMGGYGRL